MKFKHLRAAVVQATSTDESVIVKTSTLEKLLAKYDQRRVDYDRQLTDYIAISNAYDKRIADLIEINSALEVNFHKLEIELVQARRALGEASVLGLQKPLGDTEIAEAYTYATGMALTHSGLRKDLLTMVRRVEAVHGIVAKPDPATRWD